jgi:small subunit ribosomal protein S21e
MQNEDGKYTDLYIPRKCSATNRIITATDHASVQINIGHVNADGKFTGQSTTLAFSGFIRAKGESDAYVNHIAASEGLIKKF